MGAPGCRLASCVCAAPAYSLGAAPGANSLGTYIGGDLQAFCHLCTVITCTIWHVTHALMPISLLQPSVAHEPFSSSMRAPPFAEATAFCSHHQLENESSSFRRSHGLLL